MKLRGFGLALVSVLALSGQTSSGPPAGAQSPTPPARKATAPPSKPAAAKAASAPPSYRDLKYPPLAPLVTPPLEPVTLPNGMRLFLVEDHTVALINGLALVHTGNVFDPQDRIGLALLTGEVLRSGGTHTRLPSQLNSLLEDMGATIDSNIGESSASISFSGLPEDAEPLLVLFKDVLTQPEFRQEQFNKAKQLLRSNLLRANDDLPFVARREFSNAVYGKDTPYGAPVDFAGFDRITSSDVRSFYQRYYFPKNTMLAVWGDFDSGRMKASIERLFADWTVEQPPVPEFPKVTAARPPATYLVKKAETITQFVTGLLVGDLRDPDGAALDVMAEALGGGPFSRLSRSLAPDGGNATAAWAPNFDHPGLFVISVTVPTFHTAKAVRTVRTEAAALGSAELTDEEFAAAKQRALTRLILTYGTKTRAVERLMILDYFGYPGDFTGRYQKALEAVTRADILRVAKQRIDPAKFTLVIVGDPVSFDEPPDRLGAPVNAIELPTPPKTAAANPDEVARQRGKELLARAQTAAGGAEKLAAVKDFTLEAVFQFSPGAGAMLVNETDRWIAPEHFRQDSVVSSGRISAYTDGETGWIASPKGSGPLDGTPLKQVRGSAFRAFVPLLLSDRTAGRAVKAIDDATVEISDTSGQSVRLVMNSDTGLPLSALYDTETANGPVAVVETYTDYHAVGGLTLPFHVSIKAAGASYAEVTIRSFQANTGLLVKDLEKKP